MTSSPGPEAVTWRNSQIPSPRPVKSAATEAGCPANLDHPMSRGVSLAGPRSASSRPVVPLLPPMEKRPFRPMTPSNSSEPNSASCCALSAVKSPRMLRMVRPVPILAAEIAMGRPAKLTRASTDSGVTTAVAAKGTGLAGCIRSPIPSSIKSPEDKSDWNANAVLSGPCSVQSRRPESCPSV